MDIDTALHTLLEGFELSFWGICGNGGASEKLQATIDCNAVVRKIRMLLEAGADPQAQNDLRERGTAMNYFQSIRDGYWERHRPTDQRMQTLFNDYCEEIEEAMQSAVQP